MPKLRAGFVTVGAIATNCYILVNEETKELLLLDPGDEAERILQKAFELGDTLTAILLTHGHFDHILAVNEIRKKYPQVRVYAAERERELLLDPRLNQGFHDPRASVEADIWLRDHDTVKEAGFSFSVLETPGHTDGSVCYYMENEKLLFSGDTLFRRSYGRVDLPTGSEEDMEYSLSFLLGNLPEDVRVLPGHGELTTIGAEKRAWGIQ
ncbi:MAG: MBL fold metallo-hydrolase [Lachnospiraceae bacterium]|nr:MBL fold metallo-hydrolase [Lachnospiraceae bacterium]